MFVCVCDPHCVHVNAVGVGPGVLEVLLQPLPQRVGDLVEADELPHPQHLGVVARRARVQTLDDGRHVAEDAGVHEGWEDRGEERRGEEKREKERRGEKRRGEERRGEERKVVRRRVVGRSREERKGEKIRGEERKGDEISG